MDYTAFLTLLHQVENLKNTTRHSWTSKDRHESVAEHSFRLCMMAYFLQDEFPEIQMDKVMKMCLFHDIGEAFTGDIPSFEKKDQDEKKEEEAIHLWLTSLPALYQEDLIPLFEEMLKMNTPEAKFYKALDKLEVVLQHQEGPLHRWLPIEYDLNFTYGIEEVEAFDYLKNLRKILNKEMKEKVEKGE